MLVKKKNREKKHTWGLRCICVLSPVIVVIIVVDVVIIVVDVIIIVVDVVIIVVDVVIIVVDVVIIVVDVVIIVVDVVVIVVVGLGCGGGCIWTLVVIVVCGGDVVVNTNTNINKMLTENKIG